MEIDQLTATEARAAPLFDERQADLRLARRRLDLLYRWGLAWVGLIVGFYLLAVGGALLLSGCQAYSQGLLVRQAVGTDRNTTAVLAVLAAVVFVAFVVARYEAGMTKNPDWHLLRGGAGYLMGSSFTASVLFVGALFAHDQNHVPMGWLGLVVPSLMVLVGSEMLLWLVLGSYRPRRVGQAVRPAFDSRLLGWMTSPGSIAQAIGESLNYQFGFEVSRNWFYQLLSRAVAPLAAFGMATLVLFSGVVIVEPYQKAVVTRFGRIRGEPLGPGLHLKMPWPVDRAQKFDVGRVHQVLVGSAREPIAPNRAVLWDNQHASEEDYLITAPTRSAGPGAADQDRTGHGASGLSLLGAQIAVQYRIANLKRYCTVAADGRAMLTAMADRRVNAYFVTQGIDTLLGSGRVEAGRVLQKQIQTDVDAFSLGLEVMFVGLTSVHPPFEEGVAAAFLQQIGALQEQQSLIEQAKKTATETLVIVAGSPDKAVEMDRAIVELEQSPRALKRANRVEQLLTSARGQAAQIIDAARAQRWQRSGAERAAAERFGAEVLAYRNAPDYFRARRYLDALTRGLATARKYVVATDDKQPPVFRIDLKDSRSTLDAILQDDQ